MDIKTSMIFQPNIPAFQFYLNTCNFPLRKVPLSPHKEETKEKHAEIPKQTPNIWLFNPKRMLGVGERLCNHLTGVFKVRKENPNFETRYTDCKYQKRYLRRIYNHPPLKFFVVISHIPLLPYLKRPINKGN